MYEEKKREEERLANKKSKILNEGGYLADGDEIVNYF